MPSPSPSTSPCCSSATTARAGCPRSSTGSAAQPAPVDRGRRGRHRQQGRQRRPARAGLRRRGRGSPAPRRSPRAVELGLERLRATAPDASGSGSCTTTRTPTPGALAALLAAAAERPRAPTCSARSCASGPRCGGCSSSASRSPAPAGARPGSSAASTTRASTTRCATVLAVNTAGMLVRRAVLEELGGFDDQLPIFGNDIDFGWRAAAAGHRTLVVPAGGRLPRRGRPPRRPPDPADRPAHALPGAPRRALHAARQRPRPRAAAAGGPAGLRHAAADGRLPARPLAGRGARRPRRAGLALRQPRRDPRRPPGAPRPATAAPTTYAGLLSPWWLPYRHGLDFLCDLAAAATNQAADVAERRRAAAAEHDPVVDGRPAPSARRGRGRAASRTPAWSARFFTNPVALLLAVFVVLALVGARGRVRRRRRRRPLARPRRGRRLVAAARRVLAPARPGHRRPGTGVRPAARAARDPLARQPAAAGLGAPAARRAGRRCGAPGGSCGSSAGWCARRVRRAGCCCGARRPTPWSRSSAGAWGDGRLGAVVAGALLPWLAHAALGFADPDADRRWRAAWRTGLLLALISAFTPGRLAVRRWSSAWSSSRPRSGSSAAPSRTARSGARRRPRVGVVPVLLAPWWLPGALNGAGAALLLDAGRLPGPAATASTCSPAGSATSARPGGSGSCSRCSPCSRWCRGRPGSRSWSAGWSPPSRRSLAARARHRHPRAGRDRRPGRAGLLVVVLQGCFVAAACSAGSASPGRAGGAGSAAPVSRPWSRWPRAVPLVGLGWFDLRQPTSLADDADDRHPRLHGPELGDRTRARHPRGPRQRRARPELHRPARGRRPARRGRDRRPRRRGRRRSPTTVRALVSRPTPAVVDALATAGSSTSCCPRPPTPTSPPPSTRPAAWCRRAPRTAPPGPGRSTGRSTRRGRRAALLAAGRAAGPPGPGAGRRAGALPAHADRRRANEQPTPGRRSRARSSGPRLDVAPCSRSCCRCSPCWCCCIAGSDPRAGRPPAATTEADQRDPGLPDRGRGRPGRGGGGRGRRGEHRRG